MIRVWSNKAEASNHPVLPVYTTIVQHNNTEPTLKLLLKEYLSKEYLSKPLEILFNASFSYGTVPDNFKVAQVIPEGVSYTTKQLSTYMYITSSYIQ